MSKLEQKVGLDASEYTKGTRDLAKSTQQELKRVNNEFNQAGNGVSDFSERSKRSIMDLTGSLSGLAQGFASGFKGIGALGLGVGAAAGAKDIASHVLSFSGTINKMGARQGLNDFQRSELRNQLLDVSSERGIADEEVAAAADIANQYGASTRESVKFADVVATAAGTSDQLNAASLAEDVAKDLRARGEEVTAETAKKSIDALLTGARAGFGDIGKSLAETMQVDGAVQKRAGLSQRELVNILAGTRLGARGAPEESSAAVRELISITDKLEGEALQGVLGSFRGEVGPGGGREFMFGAKQLDEASKRLASVGDDRVQRQLLTDLGFSSEGSEGLLSILRDRNQVRNQINRVSADSPNLEGTFESANSSFLDQASRGWNSFKNFFSRDSSVEVNEAIDARTGMPKGLTEKQAAQRRSQLSDLAFPSAAPESLPSAAVEKAREQRVKVDISVESTDPGFRAIPKTTDLNRDARGI